MVHRRSIGVDEIHFSGLSLRFSPRGEAKCVRGPSGLGASRAEEKGARKTACKVFHESRDTSHESRLLWCLLVLEALQSCFFCPGMLGNRTGRRSPCGLRIGASQASASRKPLITRPLRKTNHETRVTAVTFFTNHESRNTNQGLCVFHESRNTRHETRLFFVAPMVLVGTEALQSFFRPGDGVG